MRVRFCWHNWLTFARHIEYKTMCVCVVLLLNSGWVTARWLNRLVRLGGATHGLRFAHTKASSRTLELEILFKVNILPLAMSPLICKINFQYYTAMWCTYLCHESASNIPWYEYMTRVLIKSNYMLMLCVERQTAAYRTSSEFRSFTVD